MEKLNDMTFFNLVIDVEYTFYKYNRVLNDYIQTDKELFYDTLKNTENIFSYSSIILNVVFAIVSLGFIIFPIKYVEMVISWLIHKLVRT
jgi:hypothetical protein